MEGWMIENHTAADKSFEIVPPDSPEFEDLGDFYISIGYDDVDHEKVDVIAKKLAMILNTYWDKHAIPKEFE